MHPEQELFEYLRRICSIAENTTEFKVVASWCAHSPIK